MSNGGYLVAPAPGEKGAEIWEETWKRVDRFLPELRKEVFPDEPASQTAATRVSDEQSQPQQQQQQQQEKEHEKKEKAVVTEQPRPQGEVS